MGPKLAPAIPDGFTPLQEAARIGKVSEKTIRNWAAKQAIGSRTHKRPGITPIKIYSIPDIQRESSRQAPVQAAIARPETKPASPSTEMQQKLLMLLDGMLGRLESIPKLLPSPEGQRDILTLDEAVARGYQKTWIRKQMREGKLTKVGRGRVSRFELEKLAGK
jgi:hypothetical protein